MNIVWRYRTWPNAPGVPEGNGSWRACWGFAGQQARKSSGLAWKTSLLWAFVWPKSRLMEGDHAGLLADSGKAGQGLVSVCIS